MARKPRIHYEDAVYHVIARGNNRARVFETDEEKIKYLRSESSPKSRNEKKTDGTNMGTTSRENYCRGTSKSRAVGREVSDTAGGSSQKTTDL